MSAGASHPFRAVRGIEGSGLSLAPGAVGENITTRGIDLLGLPDGTRLHIGKDAVVQVTGLRNPCKQLDNFQAGLMSAMLGRDAQGNITRKSGIMSVVLKGGEVRPGDAIRIELPPETASSMDGLEENRRNRSARPPPPPCFAWSPLPRFAGEDHCTKSSSAVSKHGARPCS
jgi:MOSC domain-containing protein YiiM